MTHSPKTRWQVRLLAFGFLFLGAIALLFIGEWMMRSIRPDLIPSNQIQTIPDAHIGWRFAPNQEIHARSEDGRPKHLRTNSLGFADLEHNLKTAPGTQRIAFLGDSFTAALNMDFDATFVSVLRHQLQPPNKYEIFNFGQPGFGTANHYLSWKYNAAPFHPNVVVLAFFMGNDVANNLLDYPTESFASPKFKMVNGKLEALPFQMSSAAKERPHNWFYRIFLKPSLLYQEYKIFERDLRTRLGMKRSRKMDEKDEKLPFWKRSYAPTDWQTYLPKPDAEFSEAWNVTENLLLKLRDEVRTSGAQFYVLLLPGMEAMDEKLFRSSWNRYPGIEKFEFNLDYPRKRLNQFLTAQKIPVIDITPVFLKQAKGASSADCFYFKFDRHFNAEGNRLVGETIAHHLKR